jgi:hypothetical protein
MRANAATRPPCGLVIAGALSIGAILGNAVQLALRPVGLDPALAWKDFFGAGMPRTQSALAWWTWCLVVVAAFLVAYSTTLHINHMPRRRTQFGWQDWLTAVAFVLGASLTGRLVMGSEALDPMGHLLVSLAVVVLPAISAGIGAHLACRVE